MIPEPLHLILHLCCLVVLLIIPPILILNLWLVLRVLMPIQKLSLQTAGVSRGKFDHIDHATGGIPEIEGLRRTLQGMVGHIRRDQQQRQHYIEAVSDGQEAERGRLARELHDDTIQSLIAIGQSIDLARQLAEQQPVQAAQMLDRARDQVTVTVTNLRNLIGDLRPPVLDELGLVPALHTWAEGLKGVVLEVQVQGATRRLDERLELALFRCAQEAISNSQKHSHSQQVWLEVGYLPDAVTLKTRDEGVGFAFSSVGAFACQGHYGLLGMQERVERLNGTLHLYSAINQGTAIEIRLPTQGQTQPHDTVRDPVCSALLAPQEAYSSLNHAGQAYFFCCAVCQGAFQNNPERYALAV